MDGIILVNKPQDWTSFDVCAKVRSLSKVKKVGHSGTLDPFATGVLPVFIGKATKSISQFLNGDKGYQGEITFGKSTDTYDITGNVLSEAQLAQELLDAIKNKDLKFFDKFIHKFTGKILQQPPMFSAVKVNGQPLYKLARKGIEVERASKEVEIYSFEILDTIQPDKITFKIICSKGTYIRSIAHELGQYIGCGAILSKLERFYAHPFHLSSGISIDALVDLAKIGMLDTVLLRVEDVIK